jgi:type I restriction enzyme M protein
LCFAADFVWNTLCASFMHWIAPSEKDAANGTLEKRLWAAADRFRANSGLKSQEYSTPVLGLIFLRFAEVRFAAQRARLGKITSTTRRGSRIDDPTAYHADGMLYLKPNARFDHLLALPEASDVGRGRHHPGWRFKQIAILRGKC